jgi:hypothetical protein
MKSIIDGKRFAGPTLIVLTFAFAGMIALATATTFADRGRGSIRAEARPAPAARAEPARAEPARAEPARAEPARPARVVHPDVRPAPARDEPARRDWDAGDEDVRHYGGFAPPVPDHVFRGARFRALPDRHFDVVWNNQHYFWDFGGGYYLLQPDGEYVVVQPPVGVLVPDLPVGAVPIALGPTTYYYLDGVFYVAQPNGYAVVNPPPGIVVPVLPTGAAQVVISGTVVYQFGGFNYTPSLYGGVTAYTVTPA